MVENGKTAMDQQAEGSSRRYAGLAEQLTYPQHRDIFRYWLGKFDGDLPPGRRDIDPIEIGPAILPWIILYAVEWDGGRPRFRFRLVGTGIVQRYDRDSTGKYFEDVYEAETLVRQSKAFTEVALNCTPSFAKLQLPVPGRDFISYERLLLPLAGADEKVEAIMAVMVFAPN
jgi:hypothetical protein